MNDQPWPLRDVVSKLCDAAEILLHEKNYDGHGWEEISEANKRGRHWLATALTAERERVLLTNAGTQRPGSPDVSLATETRKPGSLK